MPLESKFLDLLRQLSWRDIISVDVNYNRIFGTGLYNFETEQVEDYENWRRQEMSKPLP